MKGIFSLVATALCTTGAIAALTDDQVARINNGIVDTIMQELSEESQPDPVDVPDRRDTINQYINISDVNVEQAVDSEGTLFDARDDTESLMDTIMNEIAKVPKPPQSDDSDSPDVINQYINISGVNIEKTVGSEGTLFDARDTTNSIINNNMEDINFETVTNGDGNQFDARDNVNSVVNNNMEDWNFETVNGGNDNKFNARDDLQFNPVGLDLKALAHGEISPRYMSNAKRMARGLSPRAPIIRDIPTSTVSASYSRRSSTPDLNSRSMTGTISVVSNDNSSVIGYVSATPNKFGQYGLCTDINAALKVSFTVADDSSAFDITASNGITDFPFFGAIVGHASKAVDLVSGALNYVAIGGVEQCGLGAIPSLISNAFSFVTGISVAVESAIWTISDDLKLNIGWINSDGSKPSTDLVYVSAEDSLVLVGDLPVFRSAFSYTADVSVSCSLKVVVS